MEKAEVLCIGIACMDVLIKNVDLSVPFDSETKPAEHVTAGIGGDAANESIILSRLGHRVKIMCGIGQDGVGQFIRSTLVHNGVDLEPSVISGEGESAVNVIVIQKNGDRNFINSGVPKAACFQPDLEKIKAVKVVSLASLFLPPFTDADSLLQTARRAKEIGAAVCLDVVVSKGASLEPYKAALQYVDYIFPNREEARELTGETKLEEMADVLLGYGIQNVIIKTGKDGCYVKNGEGSFLVPGYKVNQVIDTTGAGDNFAAGLISGILQKMPLRAACRYACGIAGVSIQSQGACSGVKSRKQAAEMINKMEQDTKEINRI